MKERLKPVLRLLKGLQPRARLALAGFGVLFIAIVLATCSACRRSSGTKDPVATTSPNVSPVASLSASAVRAMASAAGVDEPLLWQHARRGDVENLSNLAEYEGPVGLAETADRDPSLRPIAIQAMGYVPGWAQLPYLAKAATGTDESADFAVSAVLELAERPRTSVDPEDAEELAEGCSGLLAIAKDSGKPKVRRISLIRALRMMPCPKPEDVPTDLDAK